MTPSATRPGRLRALATARSTLLVFAALVATVAVVRATSFPDELTLAAWPAFAAAMLVDAALFNEVGVAVGDAGFWALFVAGCYLEAALGVAVWRALRAARVARRREDTA